MPPLEGLSRIFCSQLAKMMDAKCARMVLVLACMGSTSCQGGPVQPSASLGVPECPGKTAQGEGIEDCLQVFPSTVHGHAHKSDAVTELSTCTAHSNTAMPPNILSLTPSGYNFIPC